MYNIIIRRIIGKKTNDERIKKQIDYLVNNSLGSHARGWELERSRGDEPKQTEQGWAFTFHLSYHKPTGSKRPQLIEHQWSMIAQELQKAGNNVKFADSPWSIITEAELPLPDMPGSANKVELAGQAVLSGDVLTWKDIHIPPELLGDDSDEAIAKHPCFKDLYGLNAQIRLALTGIQSAAETEGKRRGHFVFFGRPACGKTSVLLAIERMLGAGAVLKLDATSTTRPGLEKLFFDSAIQIPPLVFCEEIEKAKEDWLQVWLGALDDRGELRKANYRVQRVRQIEILFLCTVNNKQVFDKMMSHDTSSKERGALSSRCVNQLYFPRPSTETIRQILLRDIRDNGGSVDWVQPAMELAKELSTDDPREIVSFLAGGDRLLTGKYQKDRLMVHQLERNGS